MTEVVKIQAIEAKPGTKNFGYLKVHKDSTMNIEMPLGIINGVEPGPTLALTGGLYGTLYPATEAVIRTFPKIDPQKLKGVLLLVPVIDMPAFQGRVGWINPIDGKSVYKAFPGKPNGSASEMIAYTVFNEVVKRSQYHIDLRGGDIDELLISFTIYCKIGNEELDKKTKTMARVYGIDTLLETTLEKVGITGVGFLPEACKAGVASITAEAGIGMGRLDEDDVKLHITGIDNVMKHLGMIEGSPKQMEAKFKVEIPPVYEIHAKQGGLFYPEIEKLGTLVTKDELLGTIKDLQGNVVEELRSPVDGNYHVIFTYRAVRVGDLLITVRRVKFK